MRKVGWATLALFCCFLTACNGDASSTAESTDPTPSASVTSSSSDPSPTPDTETPEEFVRAWVAEYNAMQLDGDTKSFRSISRRCEACTSAADRIDAIYKNGGFIETDGWTVKSTKVSSPNAKGQRVVTLDIASAPTRFAEAKGEAIQTFDGGAVTARLSVELRGIDWNVFGIEQVAQ